MTPILRFVKNEIMLVLGIDPGATGALALLDTDLDELVVRDMPTVSVASQKRLRRKRISASQLSSIIHVWRPRQAFIERVHAMPAQGVTSSFNFGMAYGLACGVLAGLSVPYHEITPQEWKRAFHLGADKQEARLIAARLFPRDAQLFARACDDGRAEAALLALFGSRYPL